MLEVLRDRSGVRLATSRATAREHNELMERRGLYHYMCGQQLGM